jgi:hypothetical protein
MKRKDFAVAMPINWRKARPVGIRNGPFLHSRRFGHFPLASANRDAGSGPVWVPAAPVHGKTAIIP